MCVIIKNDEFCTLGKNDKNIYLLSEYSASCFGDRNFEDFGSLLVNWRLDCLSVLPYETYSKNTFCFEKAGCIPVLSFHRPGAGTTCL